MRVFPARSIPNFVYTGTGYAVLAITWARAKPPSPSEDVAATESLCVRPGGRTLHPRLKNRRSAPISRARPASDACNTRLAGVSSDYKEGGGESPTHLHRCRLAVVKYLTPSPIVARASPSVGGACRDESTCVCTTEPFVIDPNITGCRSLQQGVTKIFLEPWPTELTAPVFECPQQYRGRA